MSKRRIMLLLIFLTVVSVGGVVTATLMEAPGEFNEWHIARLKPGMTRDEVIAVFGCPPGDYTGGKQSFQDDDLIYRGLAEDNRFSTRWCGKHGAILVSWDENGRLQHTSDLHLPFPQQPTMTQRLQRRWSEF